MPPVVELLKLTGDAKAGAVVFRDTRGAHCVTCHQIKDEGKMIGPPLTTIGEKLSKQQLYESILTPSAAILMGYENWVVKTKKGQIQDGLLVEDTDDHVTLKDTQGEYHDFPATDIAVKVKQTVSIMPDGLTPAMTRQDLVNLVEYLASLKYTAPP